MDLPFIPYFQTTRYRVDAMMELAEIKPGELAADLGSGDGRILVELAKRGAKACGYELDEKLIQQSQENIEKSFPSCHPERVRHFEKDSPRMGEESTSSFFFGDHPHFGHRVRSSF